MMILGVRFRAGRIFAKRRTAFLCCLLLGLLVSGWRPVPVHRSYATYVYLKLRYDSWEEYGGVRLPRRNCGILSVKLDENRSVTLNNEPKGTIDDLGELRKRLERIVEERRQKRVILDLGPEGEKRFGYRTVNAEIEVRPADNSKYGDFVRLVDLAASLAPSVVYVATPSYEEENLIVVKPPVIRDRLREEALP